MLNVPRLRTVVAEGEEAVAVVAAPAAVTLTAIMTIHRGPGHRPFRATPAGMRVAETVELRRQLAPRSGFRWPVVGRRLVVQDGRARVDTYPTQSTTVTVDPRCRSEETCVATMSTVRDRRHRMTTCMRVPPSGQPQRQ